MELVSGVGTWSCAELTCTAAVMPVGEAVFSVSGTVSSAIPSDVPLINAVEVRWENDIFGPDFPVQVAAAIGVRSAATPVPAKPSFTG